MPTPTFATTDAHPEIMAPGIDPWSGNTGDSADGNVDAKTGNAAYSYRFVLPPGRDGLTPDLTLNYSSAGGSTWVGRGFTPDTPIIQRDTPNGVPSYGPDDRFVFGSMPLIPWKNRPGLGMECRMARDDEDVQFLLQDDNVWRVRRRDGRESFYSAAVFGLPRTEERDPSPEERKDEHTFAWRLTKVRDRNGNTIEYEYDVGYNYTAHQGLEWSAATMPSLLSIRYGGNEGDPANGVPPLPHLFRVWFRRVGYPLPRAQMSPRPWYGNCVKTTSPRTAVRVGYYTTQIAFMTSCSQSP